ncbi:hypothetical protein [Mycobacterium riyadhense]|nr:hypothetical protein [Mycobacterium riyadhense]
MFDDFEDVRDLSVLEVRAVGSLAATGSKWEPWAIVLTGRRLTNQPRR